MALLGILEFAIDLLACVGYDRWVHRATIFFVAKDTKMDRGDHAWIHG